MRMSFIFILVVLSLASCFCSEEDQKIGDAFSEYVSSFKVELSTKTIPELQTISDSIYKDVLALKNFDSGRYKKLVCEFLMKYDDYYIKKFNQSYSLINPDEIKSKKYTVEGNNKFFLLRCFMKFSKIKVREDGFPSNSIKHWYETVGVYTK